MTEPYWIAGPWTGRLAISARPRGGEWLDEEMFSWRRLGVHTVVSLLTADEEKDLDLEREGPVVGKSGMMFVSFPITDRSVPDSRLALTHLAAQLNADLAQGKNVVIHCRQGIGRAALVAATVLLNQGREIEPVLLALSKVRGVPVPETPEQRAFLLRVSEDMGATAPSGSPRT